MLRLTRSCGQAPSLLRRRNFTRDIKLQIRRHEEATLLKLTQESINNKRSIREIRLQLRGLASSQLSKTLLLACIKATALLCVHLRESNFFSRVLVKCENNRHRLTNQHYHGFSRISSEIQMHLHPIPELQVKIHFFIPGIDLIPIRS